MTQRFAKAENLAELAEKGFIVKNDLLKTNAPSVAYCTSEGRNGKVYFNNVVLPEGGGPIILEDQLI